MRVTGIASDVTAVFVRLGPDGQTYHEIPLPVEMGTGTLNINCTNHWLRHLGAYVEFLDAAKKPITPVWNSRMPGFLHGAFESSGTKKFLDLIPPVQCVFGIPIPAESQDLSFPLPQNCSTVRLYWGGMGRGQYDSSVCAAGIVFTVVVDMALPVMILLAGSMVEDTSVVQNILKDKEVLYALLAACAIMVTGGSATAISLSHNPGRAAKNIAVTLGPMLAKPALSGLAKYIARKIGEGVAKRAIPFINGFMELVNIGVTLAVIGLPMEKYVFHPAGYVLGISYECHKVFLVELKKESDDLTAPIANMIWC